MGIAQLRTCSLRNLLMWESLTWESPNWEFAYLNAGQTGHLTGYSHQLMHQSTVEEEKDSRTTIADVTA
uniref:Uncharacterized protein n=1 Tax=Romanomermis culicivorax TaxID=13658 RepID=A0A915HZY3_ROMCU